MTTKMNYLERFMLHTELYMVLTGKQAEDLTMHDIDKISDHLDLLRQQKDTSVSVKMRQQSATSVEFAAL